MSKPSVIQMNDVSPDVIQQHQKELFVTATNVFQCAINTQNQIVTVYGPNSIHENKDKFPKIGQLLVDNIIEFSCISGQVIHINQNQTNISIVLDGLENNIIIIHNKINHVLIRKSNNVKLDIKCGTVSGVDILYCNKMYVRMPQHNFTNLEFGEAIYFDAEINSISHLHIIGSLDVKLNGISIPINPFINAIFDNEGWSYMKQSEIPKLMICRY